MEQVPNTDLFKSWSKIQLRRQTYVCYLYKHEQNSYSWDQNKLN